MVARICHRIRTSEPATAELESLVWAAAGRFRQDLVDKLKRGASNDYWVLAKFVEDPLKPILEEARKPCEVS